jgi:hypothetical protein
MSNETKSIGRPSDYSDEIAEKICNRLGEHETLREICLDPTMPERATILDWLAHRKEFRDRYRDALEWAAEDWADETYEIIFDTSGGYSQRMRRDGRIVVSVDRADLARRCLRVKLRQWVACRLAPHKYFEV